MGVDLSAPWFRVGRCRLLRRRLPPMTCCVGLVPRVPRRLKHCLSSTMPCISHWQRLCATDREDVRLDLSQAFARLSAEGFVVAVAVCLARGDAQGVALVARQLANRFGALDAATQDVMVERLFTARARFLSPLVTGTVDDALLSSSSPAAFTELLARLSSLSPAALIIRFLVARSSLLATSRPDRPTEVPSLTRAASWLRCGNTTLPATPWGLASRRCGRCIRGGERYSASRGPRRRTDDDRIPSSSIWRPLRDAPGAATPVGQRACHVPGEATIIQLAHA